MNEFISITEFAEMLQISTAETYKLIKNNFSAHLRHINSVASVEKEFVDSFLSLNNSYVNDKTIADYENIIVEKEQRIAELENKLLEYSDKAFDLAQTAFTIQQQLNYITANQENKKQNIFRRLLKK